MHRPLHCLENLTMIPAAQCSFAYAAQALIAATACKRSRPLSVQFGFKLETNSDMEHEGRTITAEFERFYIVSTYFPNSGKAQAGLDNTCLTESGRPNASTACRT